MSSQSFGRPTELAQLLGRLRTVEEKERIQQAELEELYRRYQVLERRVSELADDG